MNKIEKIKSTLKRSKTDRGLTMHEVVARSKVPYSTARRHMTRLLDRGEATYAEYYKRDPSTKNTVLAYIPA